MSITTRAALIYETDREWDVSAAPWKVEELELADPGPDDVLVHLPYSGVCHSDLHLVTGDLPPGMLPFIGGHEGAGVVEDVGANVTHVAHGDHVVLAAIPSCGTCWFCVRGEQQLCDQIAWLMNGKQADRGFRFKNAAGQDCGQMARVSTFAEWTIVPSRSAIKIDKDIPLEVACLIGCGVTTGFGAATERANVHAGDFVVVWGCGGVGIAAVQGAAAAGAAHIVAVDINDAKLEAAEEFGATRTINCTHQDVAEQVMQWTGWRGADSTIMTPDLLPPKLIGDGFRTIRRGGTLVLVSCTHSRHTSIEGVMPVDLAFGQKTITGCVYGGARAGVDLVRNLDLYRQGRLRVEEMITRRYPLQDINLAFDDMVQGKNIRGLIEF